MQDINKIEEDLLKWIPSDVFSLNNDFYNTTKEEYQEWREIANDLSQNDLVSYALSKLKDTSFEEYSKIKEIYCT